MAEWGIEEMDALTEGYDDWFQWLEAQKGKEVTNFQPRTEFSNDVDYQAQTPALATLSLHYDKSAEQSGNKTFWVAGNNRMCFAIEDTVDGGRISGGRIRGD